MKGFKTLEQKYGIMVAHDDFVLRNGKLIETFKLFSADGCPWENGLTRNGVRKECEEWGNQLIEIKKTVEGKMEIKLSELKQIVLEASLTGYSPMLYINGEYYTIEIDNKNESE